MRGANCWPGGGRWRATAVQAACRTEGATADLGGGEQLGLEEARTQNMQFMVARRVVSKLSGWLKLCACCGGVASRAHGAGRAAGREARGGRRRATAVRAACRGWRDCTDWGAGQRGRHTWNMWSISVTLDVSKLTGWLKDDVAAGDCAVQFGARSV